MPAVDKSALLATLRDDLQRALDVMLHAARSAAEAATHEESKPENDKDTRGLEQSYLARGQAARAAELKGALAQLASLEPRAFGPDERVSALALVEVVDLDSDAKERFFVSPFGGGLKVSVGGVEVKVVTAQSPIGDALIGKRVGDLVEVTAGGRVRELEIVGVS